MPLMSQHRALRAGALLLLLVASAGVACTDVVTATRPRVAADATLSEGTATFYSLVVNQGGAVFTPTVRRAASILEIGGHAHLAVAAAEPSSGHALGDLSQLDKAPPPTTPRFSRHFKTQVIADRIKDGKRYTMLAIADQGNAAKKPPQALISLVDLRLVEVSAMRYEMIRGKWALTGTTTTNYDKHGQAKLVTVMKYSGDRKTAASSAGSRFRSLAEAAVDALLPARLEAQADPCNFLYDIMISLGAIAAAKADWALEAAELCEIALVESPEAAVLICADAALARTDATNALLDAQNARADYLLCRMDHIQVLPEVVIIGTPPKDCYDYDVWVSDPDQEDMGWWETWNSCDAET